MKHVCPVHRLARLKRDLGPLRRDDHRWRLELRWLVQVMEDRSIELLERFAIVLALGQPRLVDPKVGVVRRVERASGHIVGVVEREVVRGR